MYFLLTLHSMHVTVYEIIFIILSLYNGEENVSPAYPK